MRGDGPGIAKAKRTAELLEEAVEGGEHGRLVRTVLAELGTLLDTRRGQAIECWGDTERGGATLIRADGRGSAEAMRISWNGKRIESIEVEPRPGFKFEESGGTLLPFDALVERLWRHLRDGGAFPQGSERFADFFSHPPDRDADGPVS